MITSEELFQYLTTKIPNFTKTRRARTGEILFSCPNFFVHKYPNPTATFTPSGNISCLICGFKGSLYDAIRIVEPDKKNNTDAEITDYLIGLLKLDMYTELNAYHNYGFALIPLLQNSKIPFEKGWTESAHKDKITWIKWLNSNVNIGIRTGEVSGITAIDVDLKVSPTGQVEEIYKLLTALETLTQDTPHGKHFIIKYDKELQQTTNIGGLHIDIRNDGGQIVASPSKIDNISYKYKNLGVEIKTITPELKTKLLELMKVDIGRNSIEVPEKKSEPLKLKNNNLEGCCNDTFISLGGMLIKQLSPEQTEFVLNVMNRHLLENPMPSTAIKGMLNSLEGYKGNDEETYEKIVYDYMRLMQTDVTPRDVIENTKLPRAIVDKYLSKFVKEGKAVRVGRGRYQYKERIEWSDTTPEAVFEYKYKIPFFNNVAIFQDRDVILLGAKTNDGKTTIALNMIKEMIAQGVKPYYIYSEAGSRWQKTSEYLNITGKFYRTYHENPLAIELEYNAFSIIDWLHLEHKELTDTTLKHLNDELQRKGGILVIFTQLKQTSEWFAPNLIDHYPTFAARLIQDNDSKTESHFDISKIKEPRGNFCTYILPCEYNQETRIFKKKDIV
jgi:hypothetical protein